MHIILPPFLVGEGLVLAVDAAHDDHATGHRAIT
jgi:hypothetical protein